MTTNLIIFLYGSDRYRLKQGVDSVVLSYKKKHPSGLNFFTFDLSGNGTTAQIEDAIKSASFFEEIKLIFLKNVFNSKTTSSGVLDLLQSFYLDKDTRVVVLVAENSSEEDLTKRDKELFKNLKDNGSPVKKFGPMRGKNLEEWIKKEVSLRGCSVSSVVARNLMDFAGTDSMRLICEIDKLCNYKIRGEIMQADLSLLVSRAVDLNIFHLTDAIGGENKVRALELLYKELNSSRDPYYILTMITYQFRTFLMVKDLLDRGLNQALVAKKSGIHPFVVKKAADSLNKLSLNHLKEKYATLLALDTGFKNGQIDLGDSLYNFVLL